MWTKDGCVPAFRGLTSGQRQEAALHHLFLLGIHEKQTQEQCACIVGVKEDLHLLP